MSPNNTTELRQYSWRGYLMAAAALLGSVFTIWLFWRVGHVLLLLFASLLVALILDGLGKLLSQLMHLPRHAAVILVITLLALMAGLATTLGAVRITRQAPQLQAQVSHSAEQLRLKLSQYQVLNHLFDSDDSSPSGNGQSTRSFGGHIAAQLSNAATLTLASLTDLFVVLIIGIYLALQPTLYYRGLLRLLPPDKQGFANTVTREASNAVLRWLTGRAISMTLVGLGSIIGLWALDIPFSFLLGLLAGLLTFIPYLGALLSAIPALLIAALHGPWAMVYVASLYILLHIMEGYLVDPLIQRRTASIAPGFLLSVQMLGGAIAGVPGVALATPIALVVTVIVQLGYVQNILGESPRLPNRTSYDQPNQL